MTEKKAKTKPKYALLVWAMLPEAIDYYLIPMEEVGSPGRKALRRAHGHYIGAVVESEEFSEEEINRSMLYINNALVADPKAKWIDDDYFEREAKQLNMSVGETKTLVHSWAKYKLDVTKIRVLPKLRLIQTGCIM
jgi:hypothetical protein